MWKLQCCDEFGRVYINRQHQCCDNTAMTLVILLSLKTMELHQIVGYNPFSSNSIVFNEKSITTIIAELLTLTLGVNQP